MMSQCSRVMQPADWRDHLAMLFQGFERSGELVVLSRLSDLVIQRMNTVCQIDKGTASRRLCWLGSSQWNHALEKRESDATAHGSQRMPPVD